MLYIIGGPARSGKTTLQKEILKKYKISGISTDCLRAMLQANKRLNINPQNNAKKNSKKMEQYLIYFINEFINFKDEDFVLEGDAITISLYKKLQNSKNKILFCFMGIPNININDKLKQIRKKENKISWTKRLTNKRLLNLIKILKKESKQLEKECLSLNIEFIDTSNNFKKKIKDYVNKIKQ